MSVAAAVRDVVVRFGGVEALGGVTLEVARGEVVGLIGPNGAGKTTLVGTIAGSVRPDSGSVELGGSDVTSVSSHERARRGLRRMFQYGGLVDDESVLMNMLIAHHSSGVDALGNASVLMDDLGISAERDRPVADLPAGTRRLVELGCVLAGDPSVMLLDEPSAGLTRDETVLLSDRIRRYRSAGERGVLVVAHDMRFVMGLADRVVVLAAGRVIAEGTPESVRGDERVRALYLGARG